MLKQRLEVVKLLENGKSSREIAQIMGVGRTQIQTINKRKAEILEDYENNVSTDRKRHKTGNELEALYFSISLIVAHANKY
jgi:transposase